MKFKKRIWIPILFGIFLILAAVCLVGLYAKYQRFVLFSAVSLPSTTPTPFVPKSYIKISQPEVDTSSWRTFGDKKLGFSISYPPSIILDKRQTVVGRISAFVVKEDAEKKLPGKIPVLFIADTYKTKLDGFTAFRSSDCGKDCKVVPEKVQWVNINNVYGIKNPNPKDIHNYYLTDKKQSGDVINVYVGGYTNQSDVSVNDKIATFEEVIKTFQFNR